MKTSIFHKTQEVFKQFSQMSQNFQFEETLVLGQAGCEKTSFVHSLGKNEIFGSNLLSVDWLKLA